jgi:hypothetical protein
MEGAPVEEHPAGINKNVTQPPTVLGFAWPRSFFSGSYDGFSLRSSL